jgi:hypothetical protein
MADRPLAKIGIRPDIGAPAATNAADEARFDVAQLYIIGPLVVDPVCESI